MDFTNIHNSDDLALFLGVTPQELNNILFPPFDTKKYREFEILKKNGDARKISSPNIKLKNIQ